MAKKKRRQPLNTSLAKRYNFDKGDLSANQNGFISGYQRARLWRIFLLNRFVVTLLAVVMVTLFGAFLFDILLTSTNIFIQITTAIGSLFLLGLTALLFIALYSTWKDHSRDLASGKIIIYEGKVRHKTHHTGRTTYYYIFVNDMSFSVSYEQQSAFVNNAPYRIYATPYGDVILSAEPWEQAKHGDDEAADYFLEELAYQNYQERY